MEIDKEIKDEIDSLSNIIVNELCIKKTVFANIQIEEEYSQYDVLFSYDFSNIGIHQRGLKSNDLLIGIIGIGCYGFSIIIPDTDPRYYAEKLGIHSNYLSFLFNSIRKKLREKSQENN